MWLGVYAYLQFFHVVVYVHSIATITYSFEDLPMRMADVAQDP
jgi:hypothetical protein